MMKNRNMMGGDLIHKTIWRRLLSKEDFSHGPICNIRFGLAGNGLIDR